MRYIALVFSVIYLSFAYLQLNDPDPIWWSALYLVPSYISYNAFKGKFNIEMLFVLTALYAAFSISSVLQMTAYEGFFTEGAGMEMKTINQELAREASGLGICIVTYIAYLIYAIMRKDPPAAKKDAIV
jgi:hypothetical protein